MYFMYLVYSIFRKKSQICWTNLYLSVKYDTLTSFYTWFDKLSINNSVIEIQSNLAECKQCCEPESLYLDQAQFSYLKS